MSEKINRFPGIYSFGYSEKDIFFGRTREVNELRSLIRVNSFVVLFAKSGIGKTSLLNAGLLPLLTDLEPLVFRLQDISKSPLETVRTQLKPLVDEQVLYQFAEDKETIDIWELLKSRELRLYEDIRTPLLVFDQFEEFFAHPQIARDAFVKELAYLVNKQLPDRRQRELLSVNLEDRTHELMAWYTPVETKILLIIRSDKLHLLDELSEKIPGVLNTRYQLEPLSTEQAGEAIIQPTLLKDDHYATKPFTFSDDLVKEILNALKDKAKELVEPWQLQIICAHIEKLVKKRQEAGEENIMAGPELLDGEKGIQLILDKFYSDRLTEISSEQERQAARQIIEDYLVEDDRRISRDQSSLLKIKGATEELLRKLINSRLLRAERTSLGISYEISHDTLLYPILESKKRRISDHKRQLRDDDWAVILQELHRQKCVILCGDHFYRDQEGILLKIKMTEHLETEGVSTIYYEDENLFGVSKAIEEADLYYQLYAFFQKLQPSEDHIRLMTLPVKLFISLSPDGLLYDACKKTDRKVNYAYYNKTSSYYSPFTSEDYRSEIPFLYDLLGNNESESSMLLTNEDVFEYLGSISRGSNWSRPVRRLLKEAEVFILLGVDYKKWYLRPILWKVFGQSKAVKLSIGESDVSMKDYETQVSDLFQIEHIDMPISEFLDALEKRLKTKKAKS